MKTTETNSHNVPASARSKNYQGSLASVVGANSATAPTTTTTTGGAADTAKVAQNLAEDSTDWTKIMRKDIDERTENSLSVGKNLGVDGRATISELVATALSAASATIQSLTATALTATGATILGALTAATVSATTLNGGSAIIQNDITVGGGGSFAKGAVFYGQTVAPTNLGTYVLNYVSSVYGARVTAYDGVNYQKLSLGKLVSGSNFQLELNADGTSKFNGGVITNGIESSKGGLFFGQYASMPSGLGTYVANYVSDTYGARILAYDGAAYKDLKLGAMPTSGVFSQTLLANGNVNFGYKVGIGKIPTTYPLEVMGDIQSGTVIRATVGFSITSNLAIDLGATYVRMQSINKDISLNPAGYSVGINTTTPQYKLDVNGNARIVSDLYADATVGTRNFASRVSGWRIDSLGAADFRSIYADEMRVQAFTADISQALAGSDYLTKSVSKLSANFVVPSVNGTVRIIVDDIEGMPATRCFANGDYIRFRAFNRTSGLTIANVWGTVALDTTFGTNGFTSGTQAYIFTCTQTTGAGLTVFKGSEVLDYGTSGSGMISRTTLDAQGSPYEQIATWVSDPSNSANYTVHARLGNLNGIANCSGHGLYTDNGYFTGSITIGDLTKTNNYLSFDTVNGLRMKLNGSNVATATDISSAITTAASDATTKANSAYSNAVSYTNTQISTTNGNITTAINGIQIGGRNLARHTATPLTKILSDIQNSYISLYSVDYQQGAINTGDNFTISFDITTSSNFKATGTGTKLIYLHVMYGVTYTITSKFIDGAQTVHVAYTNIAQNNYAHEFQLQFDYYVGTVTFTNFKLEKSTKASSWSPAPEDVDASILTAQSTAISQAASNAAALYVTSSAYSTTVTQLQGSISSKVSQTDFNVLGQTVGQHTTAIQQNAQDITSKVSSTDYTGANIASLINQSASTVAINAAHINLAGAVTITDFDSTITASALGGATPNDISSAQTAAQTYATNNCVKTDASNAPNSIKNSNIIINNDGTLSNAGGGKVTIGGLGYTGALDATKGATWGTNLLGIPSMLGTPTTAGLYLTATSMGYWNGTAFKTYMDNTGNFVTGDIASGGNGVSWNQATAAMVIRGDVYVTGGNALTSAYSKFTHIDGNGVYTGTLTADQVNAVAINGSSITAGTITSGKVNMTEFTASSGFVDAFNANVIVAGRLDVVSIVTKALTSNTITATSATITNLTMTNATVTGNITATSGSVGPFSISVVGGLTATSSDNSLLLSASTLRFTKGTIKSAYIGDSVIPGSGVALNGVARFENSRSTNNSGNVGAYLDVSGATIDDDVNSYNGNYALYIAHGSIAGFKVHQRRCSSSQTLTYYDNMIIDVTPSGYSTYTLPIITDIEDGQRIELISTYMTVHVKPNSNQTIQYGSDTHIYTNSEYISIIPGNYIVCIFDAINSRWWVRDMRATV